MQLFGSAVGTVQSAQRKIRGYGLQPSARSVQPYGILQRIFGNRHLQRQGFRCRPSGRSLPLGHRAHRGRLALPVYPERLYGSVRLERPARRLPDRERNLISGGIPAGERDALRTRCGGDVYARPFRTIPEIHDSPRDKKTHGYRRPAGTGNGDNGKYGNHFPIEITHPSERLWLAADMPAKGKKAYLCRKTITKKHRTMKKIALAVAALLISVSAMAGNNYKLPFVSFGIKAGYTTNQQKIDYKALLNAETIKKNASGFNAGIVARVDFPLLPIYVQGELLYDWGKYKDVSLTGLNPTSVTTNNFSVPVLVGVGIGSSNFVKVRANVGPVFNLVSTAKFSNVENVADLENMFRKQTVTWTAGIGVDLFNIMVDIRYNGVFSKKDIANIGDLASINTRPTSWTFTIGYLF